MIKRFVFACALAAVVVPVSACTAPAVAAPSDLCDLVSPTEIGREFGEPVTVTKRLVNEPDSPWAYCLYGSATEHFLTLGAPAGQVAGNIRVVAGPDVDASLAEAFEESANERVPVGYTIDPIDIPGECAALQKAAEAVIGTVTHARGTADDSSLTCDFIGTEGTIAAQTSPKAFVRGEDLVGVEILSEPDAELKGVKTTKHLDIAGLVDHSLVSITITPQTMYGAVGITNAERTFARLFLDASW